MGICQLISAVLVMSTTLIENSGAVKCYKCSVATCHDFDESATFETDCKYSTMCLKKIYPFRMTSGEQIESIERGCASQEALGLVRINYTWVKTRQIIPLDEGCGRLIKDSDAVYCHCPGDRCNGAAATKDSSGYHIEAMASIFMFNAMRYLRGIAD